MSKQESGRRIMMIIILEGFMNHDWYLRGGWLVARSVEGWPCILSAE